jgi:hypothetical protein
MNKCTVHIMVQVEHRVWKGETNPHILIMHMAIICTTAVRIKQIQWGFEHGRLPQPVDVDASVANLRLLYCAARPTRQIGRPPCASATISPHFRATCFLSPRIPHRRAARSLSPRTGTRLARRNKSPTTTQIPFDSPPMTSSPRRLALHR